MKRTDLLLRLVESFFCRHLQGSRGVSRHTVLAYRDSLRLFLSFVADACGRQVADMRLDDLTVEHVIAFLDHLEAARGNGVTTRNLRLTAIRTFFRHLIREDPAHGAQYQRVLSLPLKKTAIPVVTYLEPRKSRSCCANQIGVAQAAREIMHSFSFSTTPALGSARHSR
jgi:site-specific recombinase XerD